MSSIIRNKKKKKTFADELADLMMPAPRAGACSCWSPVLSVRLNFIDIK